MKLPSEDFESSASAIPPLRLLSLDPTRLSSLLKVSAGRETGEDFAGNQIQKTYIPFLMHSNI